MGIKNPGCAGMWVPIAAADRIAHERDCYRKALQALRDLTDRPWEEVDPDDHIEIIDNALYPRSG